MPQELLPAPARAREQTAVQGLEQVLVLVQPLEQLLRELAPRQTEMTAFVPPLLQQAVL